MNCTICNELQGIKDNNRLYSQNQEYNIFNAFLYKDQSFSIIPSIGALIKGHFMIVPGSHCNSIVNYSLRNNKSEELNKLLLWTFEKLVNQPNSSLLCFEHGSFTDCEDQVLCSTTHAHLHIIALQESVIARVFNKISVQLVPSDNTFESIGEIAKEFNNYIAVFQFTKKGIMNSTVLNANNVESQYMRKLVSSELNYENWDWKTNIDNQNTFITIKEFDLSTNQI
jgi:hypothetical protein